MGKQYNEGGLNAINFECMNGALKIKWLQSFVKSNSIWYHVPRQVFKKKSVE